MTQPRCRRENQQYDVCQFAVEDWPYGRAREHPDLLRVPKHTVMGPLISRFALRKEVTFAGSPLCSYVAMPSVERTISLVAGRRIHSEEP